MLKEQSSRITELEQELAAANEKLAQKPVGNPDTEEALRCTISDLSEQVEELKREKESLDKTIFELREQIRVLNVEREKAQAENQKLKDELANANKKLEESQNTVSNQDMDEGYNETIGGLQYRIKSLENDKTKLEATAKELKTALEDANKTIKRTHAKIEEANAIIAELHNENKKLKKELDARIEELKKVQNPKSVKGITLDHCERMNLDALKLPCGLRQECFKNKYGQPDKCARNPKEDMKDVVEPGTKIKDRGIMEDEND